MSAVPEALAVASQQISTGLLPVDLSDSAFDTHRHCGHQYYLKYIERWDTLEMSMHLGFGKAIDEGLNAFIGAHALGHYLDPLPIFEKEWSEFCDNNAVKYSTKWDGPEAVASTGRLLLKQYVAKWYELGWVALLDPDGKPLVQVKFELQLPENVRFRGVIDIIVMTPEGLVIIVDNKTPAMAAPDMFASISRQLMGYQMAVELNKERLGIDHIDGLAFFELLKKPIPKQPTTKSGKPSKAKPKGEGPVVLAPHIAAPHNPPVLDEFVKALLWTADDIRRMRFPKLPGKPHSSPCTLCDWVGLCQTGDASGLRRRPPRRNVVKPSPIEADFDV